MTDVIDNGGPVFPANWKTSPRVGEVVFDGMTLRDYFAVHAPEATLDIDGTVTSAAAELGIEATDYRWLVHWPRLIAKRSYKYADAMIEARKVKS